MIYTSTSSTYGEGVPSVYVDQSLFRTLVEIGIVQKKCEMYDYITNHQYEVESQLNDDKTPGLLT